MNFQFFERTPFFCCTGHFTTYFLNRMVPSGDEVMLVTPAQLERARESREKALALKRKRQDEADAADAADAAAAAAAVAAAAAAVCSECQSGTHKLCRERFEGFAISVCTRCVEKSEDFDLLSKAEASSQYLLPDDTLNFLPHKVKDNPHNKTWAPMKMFLRKIVREMSHERWKGEDGLRTEKARREKAKFERDLEKAQMKAEAGVLGDDGELCESSSILAKMLAGPDKDNVGDDVGDGGFLALEGVASSVAVSGQPKPNSKKKAKVSRTSGLAGMLKSIIGGDG